MVLKLGRQPVGDDDRASLVAEGRLLTDLEHINLVKIYDLDFHNDQPFLVMEYVHGRNLEDYARDEPVTPRRAAELVAKLADALAMVHRRGIIHRDIKPRNILIDESGEPRLIDFGLARLRHAWSDCPDSTWGGTLAYMAPEQARLEHDRIGPRSDVFGLGAVLYFLLTGQPPFVGETRTKSGTAPGVATSRPAPCASPRSRAGWRGSASRPWPQTRTSAILRPRPSRRHCERDLIRPKVLGVLSGCMRPAVLGPLVLNHVWPRPDPIPSQISTAVIECAHQHRSRRRPRPLRSNRSMSSFTAACRVIPRDGSEPMPSRAGSNRMYAFRSSSSIPAYCFLIALNPNGTTQLCYPKSPEIAPAATAAIDYPPDPTRGFGLTDGAGMQAFVLVASAQPLPAYREWSRKLGDLPWKPAPIENVWQYNGRSFDRDTPRGDVRPLADLPPSLEAACRALRAGPRVEAIQALAFPVKSR